MSTDAMATPVPATASAAESIMVVVTTKRVYHVSNDKLMKPVQETNPAASSELVLCTSRDKFMKPVQETDQFASAELALWLSNYMHIHMQLNVNNIIWFVIIET